MFPQIKAAWMFIKTYFQIILYVLCFGAGAYFTHLWYADDRAKAEANARQLEGDLRKIQDAYAIIEKELEKGQATTTIYVDKWKVLKECRVTNAFKEIHDNSATGSSNLPPADFVDKYNDITCEQAAKVIRWNYLEANKKDAQINGLQEVVAELKTAIEKSGK